MTLTAPSSLQSPQRRPVRRVAIASGALLLSAALAACSSTNTGSSNGPEGEKGGTFTFGANAAPPTLNPALGDPAFNPIYQWAYEPLVVLEGDGTFSPGLATEFGYTDEENKVYELTLREGVKFSDGADLTAEGVKAYLEYLKEQTTTPGLLVQSIESIEVLSPLELRLNLNRSDPGLTFYFAQAFGAGNVISPEALKSPDTLNTASAGAGPYMVDPERSVANDRYTYVPNPNYYDKDAIQFDEVVVQVVANPSSLIQAIRAGQIQAGQGDATTIEAAESADIEVVGAPQALTGLNLADRAGTVSEPLGDVRVRRALNLAVDREAIAEGLYGDADLALTQYALPDTQGFDETLDEQQAYDPAEAKRLLAEAGYPDGFELPTLTVPLAGLDKMVQAVAGDLEEVGVTLDIEVKPTPNDYFTSLVSGEFPVAALAYGLNNANSLYAGVIAPAGPFNPFKTTDPELDKLYAEYFATPAEDSADLEQAINGRLVDQAWALPVVGAPLAWYVADGYTGIEATTQNAAVPHFTDFRRG